MRRWLPTLIIGLAAAAFAWANRGETAAIHLGFATFYRTPVSVLVLGAFVLGMLVMFLAGLRHDLRVRRALREHTAADATEPFAHDYTPSERL